MKKLKRNCNIDYLHLIWLWEGKNQNLERFFKIQRGKSGAIPAKFLRNSISYWTNQWLPILYLMNFTSILLISLFKFVSLINRVVITSVYLKFSRKIERSCIYHFPGVSLSFVSSLTVSASYIIVKTKLNVSRQTKVRKILMTPPEIW